MNYPVFFFFVCMHCTLLYLFLAFTFSVILCSRFFSHCSLFSFLFLFSCSNLWRPGNGCGVLPDQPVWLGLSTRVLRASTTTKTYRVLQFLRLKLVCICSKLNFTLMHHHFVQKYYTAVNCHTC